MRFEEKERLMRIIVEANKAIERLDDVVDTLVGSTSFFEDSIGREARCCRDSLHALVHVTRRELELSYETA